QNTGVIATTRVASRRVIQTAAGILALYGLSPKVGALLIVIPRPVVGVVFLVVCGMITVAGIRLLSSGEKDEAYILTTAVSLVAALTLPLAAGRDAEWLGGLAPITRLLLTNAVVIATVLAIALNATLRAALPRAG
ncbi:MAG: solute carrier family 23 protein, partial [Thermoanaerobaculia bacterium]